MHKVKMCVCGIYMDSLLLANINGTKADGLVWV